MRLQAVLLSLLLAVAATDISAKVAKSPDKIESVVLMRINGLITLDATGKLANFAIETPVAANIREPLERAAKQWQFKPVVIRGDAREITSNVRFVLFARKVGADYQIGIDNVLFPNSQDLEADPASPGPPPLSKDAIKTPSYPPHNWPVTGRVLLAICVSPDGKIERVEALQSMLSNVKGDYRSLVRVIDAFEQAAVGASKEWTFKITPERARMSVEDRSGTIDVNFFGSEQPTFDKIGVWNTVMRGPMHQLPWLAKADRRRGVADFAAEESSQKPFESPIEFAEPVIGSILK